MPSNFLRADTGFPQLNESQTTDEKFQVVTDYLYMLLEQLRYSLYNLEVENLNESAIDELGNIITEDLYIQLEDTNGNIANLQVTAEGLSSRLTDTEGNVSSLQQTATTLSSKMTDLEGDISIVAQTADSLVTRISSAEGDISTLVATADSLTAQISDAESNISSLQATATSISTRVSNAEGSISTLQQTVDGFTLSVSNGSTSSTLSLKSGSTTLSSATIRFTGVVTFSDLSTSGETTINGDNITTGTISADYIDVDGLKVSNLYGRYVYLYDRDEEIQGRISITPADTSDYAIELRSYGALRLLANGGAAYMESYAGMYIMCTNDYSGVVVGPSGEVFRPCTNATQMLGTSGYKWKEVYASTSTISTSDREEKADITYGLEAYDALFDALQPCSYKLKLGESGRTHTGMIAQDIEESMEALGISSTDLGAFIKSPKVDENNETIEGAYSYGLRYEEFIGLLIWQVQALKARVAALEG